VKILEHGVYYARHGYVIELGPEDEGKTTGDLITACDNHGEYGHEACHFGGHVRMYESGGKRYAYVDVYTD